MSISEEEVRLRTVELMFTGVKFDVPLEALAMAKQASIFILTGDTSQELKDVVKRTLEEQK